MADTRMTTDIGATSIIKHQDYKLCGVLLLEKKKLIFPGIKWIQRYFIITKGAKNCCLNLLCFMDQFSTTAEWAYSMKEMECVREYCKEDEDIVGFRILFEAAKMPDIILRCDTKEKKVMWVSKILEAIAEAQAVEQDSGFESGPSLESLPRRISWKNGSRKSDYYDTLKEEYNNDTPEVGFTRSSFPETKNNAERGNIKNHTYRQAFERQNRNAEENYENVVKENDYYKIQERKDLDDDVKQLEETMVKLPISVEETNVCGDQKDQQVFLRDSSNRPFTQDKRNAVVFTADALPNDICDMPLLQSIARSETSVSFLSVKDDSDTSGTISAQSSLQVSSLDKGDYESKGIHKSPSNESNSSSSSSESEMLTFENSQVVKPDECLCEEGQNPKELLKDKSKGTFLICRKKKGLRLHVMTQAGVKSFKLFEKNGKVSFYEDFSISPDSVFSSLDNFLKHYSGHCIPKDEFSVRLKQGYKNVITEKAKAKRN